MSSSHSSLDNKRIAKNTLFLYFRMMLTMAISIYTSRVVLDILGESDFGIYNVVGGFVGLFEVFGASMTVASQRFLSFEIGKKDLGDIKKVFSTAVSIHLLFAIVILFIAEFVGVWFINNRMHIPSSRLWAANWVFQFSLLTFLVKIISIPYNAAIIAYEKMKAFAYVSIVEVSLKLGVVLLLLCFPFDHLILYSLFLCIISICVRCIYGSYVSRNFNECSYQWCIDKDVRNDMVYFAGWNMFGAAAGVANGQGINIILNLFFGPSVNAARGIVVQVQNAVCSFVNNFQLAVSPQIIKSYSEGNKEDMFSLVFRASRFSFLLMMIISVPIILQSAFILDVWLVDVPLHTDVFLQIVLLGELAESLSQPLSYAMHAYGKVRNYQIVVGCTSMLALPVAYFFLWLGFPPETAFAVVAVFVVFCMLSKLIMLRRMIQLPVLRFLKDVVLRSWLIFLLSIGLPFSLSSILVEGWKSFFIITLFTIFQTLIISFYFGITSEERLALISKIKKIRRK